MAVIKEMSNTEENLVADYKRKLFMTTSFLLVIILLLSSCLVISIFILSEKVKNDCLAPKLANLAKLNDKNNTSPFKNTTSNVDLKIISRRDWGGTVPLKMTPLKKPVPYVIIMHTSTRNCSDFKTCSYLVRMIQKNQKAILNYWDISYNFLIGGDNSVYEGRGFENQGAFLVGYNNRSISICFLGNFHNYEPEVSSIEIAQKLIKYGVENGHIIKNYQLLTSLNPGDLLHKRIKTLPNWTEKVN